MNKWHACLLLALAIKSFACAQISVIDTIEVSDRAIRESNFGSQNTKLSEGNSVAESLSNSSSVFIKNYGPGSLATSSIRGGSASHTLVLWNDLVLQNPFLGLLDLSLLDTWAMNEVQLQKGGNSALWGSGAIGGSISLQQKNNENAKLSLVNELIVGSFGRIHEKAKIAFRLGKIKSISSLSYLYANNDFPYRLNNGEKRRQSNARQVQSNFNQDFYYTPSQKDEISFHYWRSRANRQNPPTTVQTKSEAYQIDGADRFSLHWKHLASNHKLKLNAGYFIEALNYYDPLLFTKSLTDFTTAMVDVNDELKLGKSHSISIGFSQYNTSVSSPANYTTEVRERRSAIFASYRFKFIQLSGRQEYVDRQFIPFIPALGMDLPITKLIRLRGKISKNYRLPTLNDRFWENAGNPNLLPESGWSQELSFNLQSQILQASAGIFNRSIENWIQWTLLDGDNFFKPYNLNKVWSRGLEFEAKYKYKRFQVEGQYSFVKSTNTKALLFPKINVGDQLFYTPVHNGIVSTHLNFSKVNFTYRHQYASKSLGINENLDAYHVADLITSINYQAVRLNITILNIWNASYRVIERRPMPGRNFEISLNIKIKKT